MNSSLLGKEKISKLLLKLSIPSTIAMFVNGLYNVVDTIFIGRGVGSDAIAAVTVAFPIQIIMLAFSLTIGVGAASAISRNLGSGRVDRAIRFASVAMVMSMIIALLMAIFGTIFIDFLLRLFGATDSIIVYSKEYISVILLSSVFYVFSVSGNNIVRAIGKANVSMVAMLVGVGLNIILDPIFIFIFKLGIKGAAYATVISMVMSALIVMWYIVFRSDVFEFKLKYFNLEAEYVREIVSVGLPTLIRNISGSFVAMFVNNALVKYGGVTAISTYGIIHRIVMFTDMPMFGVVQGLQPIIGFNYGAKKFERVNESVKLAIKTLVIYASIVTVFILIFSRNLFYIFTSNEEVVNLGVNAIKIIYIGVPLVGVSIITAVFYQSLGYVKESLFLSLLRQVFILMPLVLVLPNLFNLNLIGVIIAFPLSDIISLIISGFMIKSQMKKFS